jgi:uncharacterized protein YbjT (DUF2867 family)
MKIVVLGATGQIGSVIYNGLKPRHEAIGTSRKRRSDTVQFDPFHDDWSLLGKTDVLINCVGQIEVSQKNSLDRVHIELAKRIIQNRPLLGGPVIIQISALGASAHHKGAFLKTKGIADDLLLQEGCTMVIRPSIVCTHRTMIVKKMLMLSGIGRFLFGVVPIPAGFLLTKIQPVMPQDLLEIVERMCHETTPQILNAVGPDLITFKDILQIMGKSRNQSLKLVEVPRIAADIIVRNIVSPLCPQIINWQQYELLFEDNIADAKAAEEILRRPLASTHEFFKKEFTNATH